MANESWSGHFGPQAGEPKCDGNEVAVHWYCGSCGVRNEIKREECANCGALCSYNSGLVFADSPE